MSEPVDVQNEDRSSRPSLVDRLRSLFGLGGVSVREDIEDALDEAGQSAEFSAQERVILKNVLALHEVKVADVMVPRADIVAIEIKSPLKDVLELFRTAGHSRVPVYSETLDDPRGMIHIRDFLDYMAGCAENPESRRTTRSAPMKESRESALTRRAGFAGIDLNQTLDEAKIVRSVLYAPPSMPALDLLVRMQATRTHMALVIDEYGGTDGLVSIEDIVEMIVGDIEDEHDVDEAPRLERLSDGSVVADARVDLSDASKLLGHDLGPLALSEGVETLGGLVGAIAGRLPAKGEILQLDEDLEVEVLDADPRRLKLLKLAAHPRDSRQDGESTGSDRHRALDAKAGGAPSSHP